MNMKRMMLLRGFSSVLSSDRSEWLPSSFLGCTHGPCLDEEDGFIWAVHNDSADLHQYARQLAVHLSCDKPLIHHMDTS